MKIRKESRSDGWKQTTYFCNKKEFNIVMTVLLNNGWELQGGSFYERLYKHRVTPYYWEYKDCFVKLILMED